MTLQLYSMEQAFNVFASSFNLQEKEITGAKTALILLKGLGKKYGERLPEDGELSLLQCIEILNQWHEDLIKMLSENLQMLNVTEAFYKQEKEHLAYKRLIQQSTPRKRIRSKNHQAQNTYSETALASVKGWD